MILDDATAARLALLAALHDIGKANVGFQTQVWRDIDAPTGRRLPHRAGHTQDLTPVLGDADRETADWFFDALGWWSKATEILGRLRRRDRLRPVRRRPVAPRAAPAVE